MTCQSTLAEVGKGKGMLIGREAPAAAYYAAVGIGDVSFEALIDTGSSITLISRDLYDKIPKSAKIKTEHRTGCQIQGVVGKVSNASIVVTVMMKVGPFCSEEHEVWVVDDSTQPFIMGIDFLDKYRIGIQTGLRKLTIGQYPNMVEVPLRVVGVPVHESFRVVNRCKVVMAPRS